MRTNRNSPPANRPPAVSVVLPVYNAADYIESAVGSILAQTYTDFELIIIDDGSTDRTPKILPKIVRNATAQVKIITNDKNLGIPKSRNLGTAAARGEYIAIQDADDISMPARFARQVSYLTANPGIAVCGTARLRLSADGEIDQQSGRLLSTRAVAAAADGKSVYPTFNDLLRTNHFVNGSVMMRKSVFDQVGGYDEMFESSEDYDLWLRIAKQHKVANLRKPLYALRHHAASTTNQHAAATLLFHHLAANAAQGMVTAATLADLKAHGIEHYYRHLAAPAKIDYHYSLANTYYRNRQWYKALREYRQLKQLGGVNLKTKIRLLRFIKQARAKDQSTDVFPL